MWWIWMFWIVFRCILVSVIGMWSVKILLERYGGLKIWVIKVIRFNGSFDGMLQSTPRDTSGYKLSLNENEN